jgi:hypothetical protein
MNRFWFQSQMNRSVQVYVELQELMAADGMPLVEPKLLGFLSTRNGAVDGAFVYVPHTRHLALPRTTTLWQAKQAIENAAQP